MTTAAPVLAAPRRCIVDAGNGLKKYLDEAGLPQHGFAWVSIPTRAGETLPGATRAAPSRIFFYESGPAAAAIGGGSNGFLVGLDAISAGLDNLNAIGETTERVNTAAYAVLTLTGMLDGLPPPPRTTDGTIPVVTADVNLVIGVPVESSHDEPTIAALHEQFQGRHRMRYGGVRYDITVHHLLVLPQPLGAIVTLRYDRQGRRRRDVPNQILLSDIGTGSTDTTGRGGIEEGAEGLALLPGTEQSFRLGVKTIYDYVRVPLAARLRQPLNEIALDKVLAMLHRSVAEFPNKATRIAEWLKLPTAAGLTVDQALLDLNAQAQIVDQILAAIAGNNHGDLRQLAGELGSRVALRGTTADDILRTLRDIGWIVERDSPRAMPGVENSHPVYVRAQPSFIWFGQIDARGELVDVSDLLAPEIQLVADRIWKELLSIWDRYIYNSLIVISGGGAVLLGPAVRRAALGDQRQRTRAQSEMHRLKPESIRVLDGSSDDPVYGSLASIYRNIVGFEVLARMLPEPEPGPAREPTPVASQTNGSRPRQPRPVAR